MNFFFSKRTKMLRGVTLIELLIMMVIISILTSMVYQKMSIIRSKTQIQALNRTKIASEIRNGVLQYFTKHGQLPYNFPIGSLNEKQICKYGYTGSSCYNLDILVTENFLTALNRDDSKLNTDPNLLGFSTYWDGETKDVSVKGLTEDVTMVDTSALIIVSTLPPDNMHDLSAQYKTFTVTFNKNVWPQATGNNTVNIYKYDTNTLIESIAASNSSKVEGAGTTNIRFTLTNDLDTYTHYYVLIGNNAFKDAAGNAFTGISLKDIWDFWTGGICFVAGTPILQSDGTSKNIEDIKPNDTVLGFNPYSMSLEPQVVTYVWPPKIATDIYTISTDSTTVQVTGMHPFLTGNNTYTHVKDLHVNDTVYTENNGVITAQLIRAIHLDLKPTSVYNFATAGFENYIAAHLLVHNKSLPPSSSSSGYSYASSVVSSSSPSSILSSVSSIISSISSAISSTISSSVSSSVASSTASFNSATCTDGQWYCDGTSYSGLSAQTTCNTACSPRSCIQCVNKTTDLEP